VIVGTVNKSMAAIAFPMVSKEGPASAWPGQDLSVLVSIQREMVLSERSKAEHEEFPCILGAPQVGLSATIRKISSRTSLGVGPSSNLPPDSGDQPPVHTKNQSGASGTTVSGVTMMRDSFQADQNPPSNDPKELIEEAEARARMPPFQYPRVVVGA